MVEVINSVVALIISLTGVVVPLMTLLITLFPDGIRQLSEKYKNEISQSEENIKSEIVKKSTDNNLNYQVLEKNLKTLKRNKQFAQGKLRFLQPKMFALNTLVPLLVSLSLAISIQSGQFPSLIRPLVGGMILSFALSLYTLWFGFGVLLELADTVSTSKKDSENKIIELLSKLVEESGKDKLFINPKHMVVELNNKKLGEGGVYEFAVNKNYEIPVSIGNVSDRMAKTVELGFKFPKEFLIEKTSNLSIYTYDKGQIVRFNENHIQQRNKALQGNMNINFLKSGTFLVESFITGENYRREEIEFTIKVVE